MTVDEDAVAESMVDCRLRTVERPSLHRLPDDFLDRGDAEFDFAQPALAERDHALVNRLAAQFESRGADENQLANLLA